MKKSIKISCPKCNGEGAIDLPRPLRETLEALQTLRAATVQQLYHYLSEPVGETAINSRVDDLYKLGLVTRFKKTGKAWIYRATKP